MPEAIAERGDEDVPLRERSDAALIERYREARDQEAMRVLVERHHAPIYRRLRRELRDDADAEDCSQKVWIQVTRHLDDYRDEGKFPQFLSTITTNLIKDHWRQRGTRERVIVATEDTEEDHERRGRLGDRHDPEQHLLDDELVDRLVRELIPALPIEQRTAWLLRHESEFWEPGRRLDWSHLAELNGIGVEDAWALFESARGRLLGGARSATRTALDEDELSVFMVWTQAQRASKGESYSWDYFGELLDVPVNTMKTRYRAAQKRLAEALEDYRSPA